MENKELLEVEEKLGDFLERVAGRLSFDATIEEISVDEKGFYVSIQFFSPLGEDCHAEYFGGGTEDIEEKFINSAYSRYIDFDADKHAEFWVKNRGNGKVPGTVMEIAEDAEEIEDMLRKIHDAANDEFYRK